MALALIGQQEQVNPERQITQHCAFDLPPGWRELTVDEARALRDKLPEDMGHVFPHQGRLVFGPIERWKAGFGGGGLLILTQPEEISLGADGLQAVRAYIEQQAKNGYPRTLRTLDEVQLGKDQAGAIRAEIDTSIPEAKPLRTLEFYVPTGGRLLILSFRSWNDEFTEAALAFQALTDSLTFARPATGPREVGDQILHAAWIGALVGLVLIVLSKIQKSQS